MIGAWAIALLAWSEATTSSVADAAIEAELEAPPLSDEDLALIAELAEAAATETATVVAAPTLASLSLTRAQLHAALPRSVGEASMAAPSALVWRRHHVGGDELVHRGRTTTRLDARLDGLPLVHALTRFDDRSDLSLLDPWMLERVEIDSRGRLSLTSLTPEAALHASVVAPVRSADRSSGVEAIAHGGLGPASLSLMGGYADLGALRTDGAKDPWPWDYQRANLRARARVGSASASLVAGFDLDRLTNVVTRGDREERRQRTAGLVRGALETELVDASFTAGVQRFELERAATELALSLSLDGATEITWRAHRLILRGHILSSAIEGGPTWTSASASGGVRAALGPVDARAELGVAHGALAELSATGLTTEGEIGATIADPIAIAVAWRYGLRLPTPADRAALGATPLLPERDLLIELGPRLALRDLELGLTGWMRWIERGLEPLAIGGAAYVEGAMMVGLESRARVRVLDALVLEGAIGASARERSLATVPGLVFAGRAAWEAERWQLALFVRGHTSLALPSPAEIPPPGTISKSERGEWDGATLGLRGEAEIGAGFAIALAVENALDARTRSFASAIPEPGVDLRASLSYTFDR